MGLTDNQGAQAKKHGLTLGIVAGSITLLLGASLYFFPNLTDNLGASVADAEKKVELSSFPIKQPTMRYGFAIDTFQVFDGKIKSGQVLADLLRPHQIDYVSIDRIARNAKGVFNVTNIRAGHPYTIFSKNGKGVHFIYEPNVYEYVIFHLDGDQKVERIKRETSRSINAASGVIESSLWQAMTNTGFSYELTDKMEDALQWSVDFHHLQKGDEFKLVYEEDFVEGKPAGIGRVLAAYYKSDKKEYHAIYFDNGQHRGYYDQEGRPMKSAFLKAPLKYSRISSYYNLNRLHPILKYRRPHYGTDYAAPHGTPIMAVGDGTVSQASYTSGNGNFVKLKHAGSYETQYLHMRGFAKGIRPGARVQQGQIIGYVGATGLATGPHVCFRFWKGGKQVNHLRLNLPNPEPLPKSVMPEFSKVRDSLLAKMTTAKMAGKDETGEEVKGNP